MNGKISAVVIAFLLGVIGYQSGVLDSFLHKGVKCGSNEALNLAEEIAIKKLLKLVLDNMNGIIEYNIDKINFNTIITKTYNKDQFYVKLKFDGDRTKFLKY